MDLPLEEALCDEGIKCFPLQIRQFIPIHSFMANSQSSKWWSISFCPKKGTFGTDDRRLLLNEHTGSVTLGKKIFNSKTNFLFQKRCLRTNSGISAYYWNYRVCWLTVFFGIVILKQLLGIEKVSLASYIELTEIDWFSQHYIRWFVCNFLAQEMQTKHFDSVTLFLLVIFYRSALEAVNKCIIFTFSIVFR